MLVQVDREQHVDGLYNEFVVTGTATATPVRGVAQITAGPLRIDGPHGRVPMFYDSTMITTQQQANDYAYQMMTTYIAGLTVDLKATCLPVPHVQQGDWVKVGNPVVNGQSVDLVGMVKVIDQPSNGTVPGPCVVTVECSYQDVQTVMGSVNRG